MKFKTRSWASSEEITQEYLGLLSRLKEFNSKHFEYWDSRRVRWEDNFYTLWSAGEELEYNLEYAEDIAKESFSDAWIDEEAWLSVVLSNRYNI